MPDRARVGAVACCAAWALLSAAAFGQMTSQRSAAPSAASAHAADSASSQSQAAPAQQNSTTDDRWRFVWHQGRWWYWLPSNRWAVWDGSRWLEFNNQQLTARIDDTWTRTLQPSSAFASPEYGGNASAGGNFTMTTPRTTGSHFQNYQSYFLTEPGEQFTTPRVYDYPYGAYSPWGGYYVTPRYYGLFPRRYPYGWPGWGFGYGWWGW